MNCWQREFRFNYSHLMWHPVIRIALFISLVLVSSGGTAPGQQASASLATPNPAPTPIPLAKVALEAQSALASLQEIDASVSRDQSSADGIARTLLDLTNEIDVRIAGDTRLLTTSLSIDLRYWLKLTWQNFGDNLLVSASLSIPLSDSSAGSTSC